MKSILVPVDGSPHAGRALDIACDLARASGVEVKLLHIMLRDRDPGELLGMPAAARLDAGITAELKRQHEVPTPQLSVDEIMSAPGSSGKRVADDHLIAVAKAVLADAGEQVTARGLIYDILPLGKGQPASAIVAAAREAKVDTIVMGCRGLSAIEAFTLGSTSQEVCRQEPCACVMVH
ncbi:MAG: universal stress protein [Alphaproteobacteria bacterium]